MPGEARHVPLTRNQRTDLPGCQREQAQARIGPLFSIYLGVVPLLLAALILLIWLINTGKGDLTASRRPGELLYAALVLPGRQSLRFTTIGGDKVKLSSSTLR